MSPTSSTKGLGRSIATWVGAVLLTCGCVGDRAYDVTPFQSISSIEAFVGDYENVGKSPSNSITRGYLSDLIWAYPPPGERIKTIQVRSTGPQTLLVRALDANGAEVKASTFENGKDFRVRNGAIHINSWTQSAVTGMYPMGPMAAASRTTVSLGLDQDGNAQEVIEELHAGVLIIVPFAGGDARGRHYARIKK